MPPAHTALEPFNILVVEDQVAVRSMLVQMLKAAGAHHVWQASTAAEAIQQFRTEKPDLVLLDVVLPDGTGIDVVQHIRALDGQSWTPILFVSSLDDENIVWQGIEAGGDDYLTKPIRPTILAAKLRAMQRLQQMRAQLLALSTQLQAANVQLNQMVEHDSLTELVNRRGFDRLLQQEWRAAQREGQPLSLILCDVDHFKHYNDARGHLEGDIVLRQVGHLLRGACLRPRDVAARYGGEEFALILPSTPKSGALTLARAIKQLFEKTQIPHPSSPVAEHITLTGGISTFDTRIEAFETTAEQLVLQADKALYKAKASGRNHFLHADDVTAA